MDRRILLPIAMALLVVLAGCAGGGAGGDGAPQATQTTQVPDDGAAESTAQEDGGLDTTEDLADPQTRRYRIKRATYQVEVTDFDTARTQLRAAVTDAGGYVGSETFQTHERRNVSWRTGTIVLRVPVDQYEAVIGEIESVGNVTNKDAETVDVTGQVVDLQARLGNLRAQRERLRGMYNRSETTEDLLAVQERLSSVQGEIERLEGQLRTLENKIAYSTVTVRMTEDHVDPASVEPDVDHWYEQGLVSAFLESVDGAIVVTRMLAVFVASALPYAALFGGILGIGLVIRRAVPAVGFPNIGLSDRFRRGGDDTEGSMEETEREEESTKER